MDISTALTEALVMMIVAAILGGIIVYLLMRSRYAQLSEMQKRQEKQLQQAQEQARHFLRIDQELHAANAQRDQLTVELSECMETRKQLEGKLAESASIPKPVVSAPVEKKPTGKPDKQEVLARIKEKAAGLDFDTIGTAVADDKDDLKLVKGIGPFIEEKLNALGIYTFRQIANFTEEIEQQVNEAIEFFPGRIRRDNWKGQADVFAREKESQK